MDKLPQNKATTSSLLPMYPMSPAIPSSLYPWWIKHKNALAPLTSSALIAVTSSGPNIEKMAEQGIDAHIPDANYQDSQRGKQDAPGEGFFPRSCFKRDELQNCFICPAGEKLSFSHLQKLKNKEPLRLYRCRVFNSCPLKEKCTKSRNGRSITLNAYDEQFRAMRSKLNSPHGKRIYAKRQSIVEPVFGHIKETIGFRKFHLRGLEKVNGEFLLVCMAHNMRKNNNALKPQRSLNCQQTAEGAIP